jgi:predicted transcriptional regulator
MSSKLPIHLRVALERSDRVTEHRLLRCPEDGRWIPADGCQRCEKHISTEGGFVTCSPKVQPKKARWPEDAPIAEVLDPTLVCVDASATAKRAEEVMSEQGAAVAIVRDRAAHAIGIVSRSEVIAASPSRRIETFMTPFLITLLDSTSVADAVEVILERGLNHVPVLADGQVVGIVTPRSVTRWLAQKIRDLRNDGMRARR